MLGWPVPPSVVVGRHVGFRTGSFLNPLAPVPEPDLRPMTEPAYVVEPSLVLGRHAMIIVYNPSGLIVGVLGLFLGMLVAVGSGLVSLGGATVAAVWIGAGLWCKYRTRPDGKIGRFPAIFFIPLPFLAAPVVVMSLLALVIEVQVGTRPRDPREARFTADKRMLDSASYSGDVSLSKSLLDALGKITVEEARADNYHVFTKLGDAAATVAYCWLCKHAPPPLRCLFTRRARRRARPRRLRLVLGLGRARASPSWPTPVSRGMPTAR